MPDPAGAGSAGSAVARRLAEACLDHPAVIEADVLIEKPEALAGGVASARVVVTAAPS